MAEKQYNTHQQLDISALREISQPDNPEVFVDTLLFMAERDFSEFNESTADQEVKMILAEIQKEWIKKRKEFLAGELRRAQAEKDTMHEDEILNEIMHL